MRLFSHFLLLSLSFAFTWRGGLSTCVLDSDFGFTLNCQFKKSSIFRVRNLGGVKGYVGLGFSVGDELGFRQSLSNVEGNKRRSVGRSSGLSAYAIPDDTDNALSKKSEIARTYQGLGGKSSSHRTNSFTTIPPFKPIPPTEGSTVLKPIVVGPIPIENGTIVPQFQGLPTSIASMKAPQAFRNALQQATNNFQMQSSLSNSLQTSKLSHRTPQVTLAGPQLINVVQTKQIDNRISSNSKLLPTAIPVSNSIKLEKEKPTKLPEALSSSMVADTVKKLAAATNLSEEAITAAINIKQKQLLQQQKPVKLAITTTTTTTTTERVPTADVVKKYPLAGPSRVMNAPKEYYPVGYDKNFDDNFVSRVELPDTSFYCGEQKHFPGLYADEDLGCMKKRDEKKPTREAECEGNNACRTPKKDSKTSNIAIKAAQEAKEAQEAQQIAGAQAAHQVKAQLAEKAEQAAKAAEAALMGKQAMVEQLEHEVREAEAVVQEESCSYQQTQKNLQAAMQAACQAGHLLKTLTRAIQLAQGNLVNSQQVAEGAQQELAEKNALVDAAKARVECLLKELSLARQELNSIKQAAYRAQAAAKSAESNAQKPCRRRKRKNPELSKVKNLRFG